MPRKPRGRAPGRPALGVIPRSVTLTPDQWQYLDRFPEGASAALRILIEANRSEHDQAHDQDAGWYTNKASRLDRKPEHDPERAELHPKT